MIKKSLLFMAAIVAFPTLAAAPASITGRWTTGDGKAVVEITSCGATHCGKIQRLLVKEPVGGAKDTENPNKALRSRKLIGIPVLWSLKASDDGWTGKGYAPEEGRHVTATITRAGANLKVKGCVKIFCRTAIWKSAS